MYKISDEARVIILESNIPPDKITCFIDWQAQFSVAIAGFPGFVSLEILSPTVSSEPCWRMVQRFKSAIEADKWLNSAQLQELRQRLKEIAIDQVVKENICPESSFQQGVTEVFITQIAPEKETAYREWMAKIHQVEVKFPGFKGAYVQSPADSGRNWITLLQFDTPENLDRWLASSERQEVLRQSQSLISSLESHRVISPFAGWFSSISKKTGLLNPPIWKQTMLVLLVLFPIIMLEFKFLLPWTKNLNISLGTFIGNSISVGLIAWPFMPIAIYCLGWWLVPQGINKNRITCFGVLLVLILYFFEIMIFWDFI